MGGEACTTIHDVVVRLGQVVDDARRDGDRVGLFASLYRQVTVRIAEAIADGRFEDGPRMSRFDAHFGNRYLEALAAHRSRDDGFVPLSWAVAFDFADDARGAIVQHLVLGVNAHINLDLAVAAVRTSPGADLPALRHDYLVVNDILVDTIERLQDRLNDVSPVMRTLDRRAWIADEALMGWTIVRARAAAWTAAEGLAGEPADEPGLELVRDLDRRTARLALRVCDPPLVDGYLDRIRAAETADVAEAIGVLDSAVPR